MITVLSALVITGCTDWPMARFNPGSTSVNSSETGVSSTNVSRLGLAWERRSNASWSIASAPLQVGGVVFFSEETRTSPRTSRIVAVDEKTGAVRWTRAYPRLTRPVGVVDGLLVLNLERLYQPAPGQPAITSLQAVSVGNGAVRWTYVPPRDTGVAFGNLITGDGRMYLHGPLGLRAMEPATGRVLWTRCDPSTCPQPTTIEPAYGLAYDGGRLYLAGRNTEAGGVLDAATGRLLWSESVTVAGATWHGPAVANGRSYKAGGFDGQVAAFPAAGCGRSPCPPLWRTLLPEPLSGDPAVTATRVFVGGPETVFALDAATGRRVWSAPIGQNPQRISVAGDLVYVGGGDRLSVFRVAGCGAAVCQPVKVLPADVVFAPPVVANGRLVFSERGGVHAFTVK